jgi:hypothetical protein
MTSTLTSRERLRRLYFHEEMDRPAVIIRPWLNAPQARVAFSIR